MEMDGGNGQTETRDHTVVDIEDEQAIHEIVNDIGGKLQSVDEKAIHEIVTDMKGILQSVPRISEHRCIYRVPKNLRDINEDAYVPRLVSLGPFHHGNEGLKAMEAHKWRCFGSFIGDNNIGLDDLVRLMKKHEEKTRGYYDEPNELSSDEFVKVMLVDAIFVINLLLGTHSSDSATPVRSVYHDVFFEPQVLRDIMLLENQLPFFILQEILDFAKSANGNTEQCSITQLAHFCMVNEGVTYLNGCEVKHFVDLQRLNYIPVEAREKEPEYEGKLEKIKSITELEKAGVRFKVASTKTLLGIQFNQGVLEIPSIHVFDSTETISRNLLAYNQCRHGSYYINDYFVLMGMLIDTPGDVELLVQNNILKHNLATKQEVSKVFNNLKKEAQHDEEWFYYSDLCHHINAFCKKRRVNWKVISVSGGSIALVLTLIQTVCTIISL